MLWNAWLKTATMSCLSRKSTFLHILLEVVREPMFLIANRQSKDLLLTGKNDKSRGVCWLAGIKMRLDPHWTLEFPPFALREQDVLMNGDDQDVLRRIGAAGSILYTAEHCIDHQVLVLDSGEDRIAYCGDAATCILLYAGSHYSPVFITEMEAAYQSWQKMLAAGVEIVCPTHGKPFPTHRLREHMGKIKTSQLLEFL